MKPSAYCKRQCFISMDTDDASAPAILRAVGDSCMVWASDYPHMDITAPSVTEELYEHIDGLEEPAKVRILGANADELYGL